MGRGIGCRFGEGAVAGIGCGNMSGECAGGMEGGLTDGFDPGIGFKSVGSVFGDALFAIHNYRLTNSLQTSPMATAVDPERNGAKAFRVIEQR